MQGTCLERRLAEARKRTDQLFSLITPAGIFERPVSERHRLIFYIGHLEAFDWNHIAVRGLSEQRFNHTFDRLFEAGIDPDPTTHTPSDQPEDWPSVDQVLSYRSQVRERIDRLLPFSNPWDVEMALEHRLMHAETLAYLIHNLPDHNKVKPEWAELNLAPGELPDGVVEIPGGIATLGRVRDGSFGWDNEYLEHLVRVPGFRIDRHKVTNGSYLEFVKEGAKPPFFWTRLDGAWHLRGMFATFPLPPDWPVWVTQAEASAYCQWKGTTLPTEPQFHRAAYGTSGGEEHQYPWGDELPEPSRGNFDEVSWDPVPVSSTPAGDSFFGVAQLAGNGWEWTSSLFEPFAGFEPMPGYRGYSADFFDGQHYVLKGASPRTAACFLRRSFRNWFRPNYPYIYAGFRTVEV